MHILIVDDDEDIRAVLGLILRAQGHRVDEAADGMDALARLRRGREPGLVLLDLMLPRLDGEGLIRAMRNDPRLAGIPVCIVSGHHAARDKAQELGSVACLVKPIELDQLTALVDSVGAGFQQPPA